MPAAPTSSSEAESDTPPTPGQPGATIIEGQADAVEDEPVVWKLGDIKPGNQIIVNRGEGSPPVCSGFAPPSVTTPAMRSSTRTVTVIRASAWRVTRYRQASGCPWPIFSPSAPNSGKGRETRIRGYDAPLGSRGLDPTFASARTSLAQSTRLNCAGDHGGCCCLRPARPNSLSPLDR